MDQSLHHLLDKIRANPSEQDGLADIDAASLKNYVLSEWEIATAAEDWDPVWSLFGMLYNMEDGRSKADILNNLLVMPDHHHHQELMRKIQDLGHPSSVPYIGTMLESQYKTLRYSGSEDDVITKWFSHALADIGTPEAYAMIRKFALSPIPGIARGMRYRLRKIKRRIQML